MHWLILLRVQLYELLTYPMHAEWHRVHWSRPTQQRCPTHNPLSQKYFSLVIA